MKKNTLKRVFSALAVSAVAVSATGMTSFAANYWDLQDNKEVPFQSNFAELNPDGVDLAKVDDSEVKPVISVDQVTLDTDQIKKAGYTVNVSVNISGVEDKASNIATHLVHDTRLKLVPVNESKSRYVEIGDALSGFSSQQVKMNDGEYTLQAVGAGDDMVDDKLFNLTFEVPNDVKGGELFPICIDYRAVPGLSNDIVYCTVTGEESKNRGDLMNAWTWMNGVTNGYIKIETTTTTTAATTTTSTTTKAPAATTTTKAQATPVTTTKAQATPVATTTKDTPAPVATTTKATPAPVATTTKDTPAPVVTTKPATKPETKPENPPTGVAGVGLAAAGLALAVGTAFVLRKKED